MPAPCYVLEGTWWSTREVPLVLPYLNALAASHGRIALSHRTVRSGDDLRHWIRCIPANTRAFVYVACHGSDGELYPAGRRSRISRPALLEALGAARPGAVEFLHFGCCEMVTVGDRRKSLEEMAEPSGARWVSGYTQAADWLPSTLLDLALIAELFAPFHKDAKKLAPKLKNRARWFIKNYEQLARALGFSGLSRNLGGVNALLPERLH